MVSKHSALFVSLFLSHTLAWLSSLVLSHHLIYHKAIVAADDCGQ